MKHFILLPLVAALTACATYSKEECEHMNWGQQGSDAAMKGETIEARQRHFQEKCAAKYGVKVDEEALRRGHESGLGYFCSPSSAYQFGKGGGKYQHNCPADKEASFLSPYYQGRVDYLEERVSYLTSQVSTLQSELSSAESDLSSCKAGQR